MTQCRSQTKLLKRKLQIIHTPPEKNPQDLPDFRTTLYWNPNFQLTEKSSSFSFQTSERKGVYNIIVKGVTATGEIIFGKKRINIY